MDCNLFMMSKYHTYCFMTLDKVEKKNVFLRFPYICQIVIRDNLFKKHPNTLRQRIKLNFDTYECINITLIGLVTIVTVRLLFSTSKRE